ncbi:MAG: glycosyltransferase family 39 protein [Lachnoclostridium sp.]|nr:glycosyltransferase family 39 protein [Lachnospira sp.]MCM1248001.1 glycosyltransferase family 39 protein [Lachnoclostridium sp.]
MLMDGTRMPYGDQAQVYGAAMYFNSGNYINLSPGGYLDMYPHQLGYVAFLQLLFKLTGSNSFFMIQVINCLFTAGIVFSACLLLDDFTDKVYLQMIGTLLALLLLPLYCFANMLYGDTPSLLFSLLFLHHFIKALQNPRCSYFILCVLEITLAVLLKKNAIIMLLAAVIILTIHLIIVKRPLFILLLLALCILPVGLPKLLEAHYRHVSGYEIKGGIPAISWITMGTLEEGGCPGWFNNYPVPAYYEAGFDRQLAAEKALEKLSERFTYFKEEPVYALSFWKRKICTQWNDPFFNSYGVMLTDEEPRQGITEFIIDHHKGILTFLSLLQNITYWGVLIYLILRKDTTEADTYMLLPEVCILGEFLFSIIWEANSHCVIPYYIIMIPLACMGWNDLLSKIMSHKQKSMVQ